MYMTFELWIMVSVSNYTRILLESNTDRKWKNSVTFLVMVDKNYVE
jgi:hypothetical protein